MWSKRNVYPLMTFLNSTMQCIHSLHMNLILYRWLSSNKHIERIYVRQKMCFLRYWFRIRDDRSIWIAYIPFLEYLDIYLKVRGMEGRRPREKEMQRWYLPSVAALENGCNGGSLTRLKSGAWNCIRVSHMCFAHLLVLS